MKTWKQSATPSRRLGYYSLAQTAYSGLAGAFELPMALRLAGRLELVALVYAFYYSTLLAGFVIGMIAVRGGRASRVFRTQLSLQAGLCLGAALFFSRLDGILPLILYFSVRGIAEGLYWSARHRSLMWAVQDSGRDGFVFRLQSLSVLVSIVAPLLSGAAVTFLGPFAPSANPVLPGGYASVFLTTGSVLVLVIALSPRLDIGGLPLSLGRLRSVGRQRESRDWKAYILVVATAGVIASVGSGILNFGILRTEFGVGAFSASVALLSGLYFRFIRRRLGRGASSMGRRRKGVLVGATADALARVGYALAPVPGVLVAKGLLDSFVVPLKSLFGENILRAEIERISNASGANIAELYLYQEARLWIARMGGCLLLGLLVLASVALAGPGSERIGVRILLALAGTLSLVECRYLRGFARGDAG